MFKFFLVVFFFVSSIQLFSFESDNEFLETFYSLDWKEDGIYRLDNSHTTLAIPESYQLLVGEDAKKAIKLSSGNVEFPNLEAVVFDENFENRIYFESYKVGHFFLEDWEKVNPDSILQSEIEQSEEGEVRAISWVKKPFVDRETNTVYFSFEIEFKEGNVINSIAIKLGREGFERIMWVTPKDRYNPSVNHLEIILRGYSFDPGFQYKDYKSGDRIGHPGFLYKDYKSGDRIGHPGFLYKDYKSGDRIGEKKLSIFSVYDFLDKMVIFAVLFVIGK